MKTVLKKWWTSLAFEGRYQWMDGCLLKVTLMWSCKLNGLYGDCGKNDKASHLVKTFLKAKHPFKTGFIYSFIHSLIHSFTNNWVFEHWHWSTVILWTASNWPEMHRLTAPSIQRLSIERQLSRSWLCQAADRPCSRSAVRSRCVCHKGNASTLTRAAIYLVATHTETHADVSSYPSSRTQQT